jgi:hypothetical protein
MILAPLLLAARILEGNTTLTLPFSSPFELYRVPRLLVPKPSLTRSLGGACFPPLSSIQVKVRLHTIGCGGHVDYGSLTNDQDERQGEDKKGRLVH